MVVMDSCLTMTLFFFNVWNWYMACSGLTTIEFWRRFYMLQGENLYDFSFDTVSDNLFIIFGTHKIIRIFSPSLRALPLSGIEFSF